MDEPVLTMVTATVPPGSVAKLLATYRSVTSVLPPELLQTFLLRGEANEWSIASVWRSREQLEQYRRSVKTQPAIEMLHAAGGDPSIIAFDVVHQIRNVPVTTRSSQLGLG
jgi:heme-degrading monooxygenase HmoA